MKKEKQENIVGTRIGIYDVLYERDYKSNDGHRLYHVKCSQCGWETDMYKIHIKKAKCCTHINILGKYKNKNKWSNNRLGHIYSDIKTRCYNPNDKSYRFYGKKGIKLCEEWLNYPSSFEDWSLNNGYEDGLTIDRIDPNKNYSPENCRWISSLDNSKYKSTTKVTTVDGISHTGREWAEVLELGTNTINKMLREYTETEVKEFISKRMKDKTICRHSHETWMEAYGL